MCFAHYVGEMVFKLKIEYILGVAVCRIYYRMLLDNYMSIEFAYRVNRSRKRELLKHLLTTNNWPQLVIFVRTKHAAGRLVKQLEAGGVEALLSHNGMGKVRRSEALNTYLAGEAKILVASDMAMRGLEVTGSMGRVVNLDLPATPAGIAQRQACMQQAEENIFLLAWDEEEDFAKLAETMGISGSLTEVAGFEPDLELIEVEKAQQEVVVQKTQKRHANGRYGNKHQKTRLNNFRKPSRHYQPPSESGVDENGDVNGNTLSSDNSNRSAIDLASDGAVLHRRSRNKNRQRVNGNR
jgi:superfamily II DNA/RNA helicase